jgi:hypothetical protein
VAGAGALAFGAAEGATREDVRRLSAQARAIDAEVGYQARKEIHDIERQIRRERQAVRNARRIP